jgi:hypothetical protein
MQLESVIHNCDADKIAKTGKKICVKIRAAAYYTVSNGA